MTSSITVNADVTLTIEAGTVVKFHSDQYLHVNGGLDLLGTESSPVNVFTSLYRTKACS